MARKAAKSSSSWNGFANVPFDADARVKYESWDPIETVVYTRMEELIAGGHKVAFSYDNRNDAFQCSITCNDERSANFGYTVTARGPAWYDALSVAIFKVSVLYPGSWPVGDKVKGDKWG